MSDELNKEQAPEGAATDTGAQEAQGAQTPPSYTQPEQSQSNPYYGGVQQEKMTGIVEAYKSYWQNYVNFNDRTSRAGYWWVILVNGIISSILYGVTIGPALALSMASIYTNPASSVGLVSMFAGAGVIYIIWSLVNLLPELAICVRRLHDTGRGWVYILFNLIPFVGWIIFIVFLASATKYPPANRFFDGQKKA